MIENPQSGLLKEQMMMYGIPFKDVDYCKYGMPYRKRTRLWNNIPQWSPRPLCQQYCGSMNGNKHKAIAQRMPHGKKQGWDNQPSFKQSDLYVIPENLIYETFNSTNIYYKIKAQASLQHFFCQSRWRGSLV